MDQNTKQSAPADGSRDFGVSVGRRTPSPSGKYSAELFAEDAHAPADRRMLRVRIVPTAPEQPAFESTTAFAAWFRLRALWDANDRLWVGSGDVGIRFWALLQGQWTEFLWQSDGPKIPDANHVVWDATLQRNLFILGIDPPPSLQRTP